MAVFNYNGPWDEWEIWGTVFVKDVPQEVKDKDLAFKLSCLAQFTRLDGELPPEDPVQAATFDDYQPDSPVGEVVEATGFTDEALRIPQVGEGTIPADWETMHHSTRIKLARTLRPDLVITTAEEADKAIRDEIEPR